MNYVDAQVFISVCRILIELRKKWLVIFNVRKLCRYYKFYHKVAKDSYKDVIKDDDDDDDVEMLDCYKDVYEITDANKECH